MKRMFASLVILGFVTAPAAFGEVIHIPVGQQAPEKRDLPRPTRGMSQSSVLETYGLPESKAGPVGEPPISKWTYPNYTVYFESETVIHSVLTHMPQVDLSEKSGE